MAKPMKPRVSTLIKFLDCNPLYETATREELVRLKELLEHTAGDIDMVLNESDSVRSVESE